MAHKMYACYMWTGSHGQRVELRFDLGQQVLNRLRRGRIAILVHVEQVVGEPLATLDLDTASALGTLRTDGSGVGLEKERESLLQLA